MFSMKTIDIKESNSFIKSQLTSNVFFAFTGLPEDQWKEFEATIDDTKGHNV